jgi:hypothetical protein
MLGSDGLTVQIGDRIRMLKARGKRSRGPPKPLVGEVVQQVAHRRRPWPAPAVDHLTVADGPLIEPAL